MTSTPANDGFSKDAMFIFQAFKYSESKPKVDWVKVAEATGLKNAKTAATRFSQIVKKHNLVFGGSTSEPSNPSTAATKVLKRKLAAAPICGAKRQKKKASASNVANDNEEDETTDIENGWAKVKTEDVPAAEAEAVVKPELETKDTALDSENDPLDLLKAEMESEDAAAGAQDYSY
ncbi:hypothetical protein MMC11_001144 [Xylographa trunciseda]|nr:hypothetical protein [Xylographa trunciseda]